MTPPLPDHRPLEHAPLSWDEHGQPQSTRFDDVYFSRTDGLAETRHVFIEGNRLLERWQSLSDGGANTATADRTFTIAETGFGTGLSFLLTAQLWLEHAPGGWQLHFVSTEKYPLRPDDWRRALALWPQLGVEATELARQLPLPLSGTHRRTLAGGRIRLTLMYGDAAARLESCTDALQSRTRPERGIVDAWFLDGFAPARNTDMWTPRLYQVMARLSRPGATLATFTAAGHVRRGLNEAGFVMTRVPGYGTKREMLVGHRNQDSLLSAPLSAPFSAHHGDRPKPETPWFRAAQQPVPRERRATVVGAGIAGCATAAALAQRGWQVTLIDRHAGPAGDASGNPQGILYPRLSRSDGTLPRFALQALLHACAWYEPYWRSDRPGERCGVLLLPPDARRSGSSREGFSREGSSRENPSQEDEWSALADHFHGSGLVQLLDNAGIQTTANLPLDAAQALYLPDSGWIAPQQVCAWLIDHPNIRFVQADVSHIESGHVESSPVQQDDPQIWHVRSDDQLIISTDTLVLANAAAVCRFPQTAHLPLRTIRGQISVLSSDTALEPLRTVLCGDGYIAPAHGGQQTLGATYDIDDTDLTPRPHDHRRNLDTLAQTDPALRQPLEDSVPDRWQARVALRCAAPDYLPVIGPAPDGEALLEVYGGLRQDARRLINEPCPNLPGLFLHCALGSRGLTYAPLGAEYLADLIEGQLPALPLALQQAVHPARFLIRDLKKKRL